MATVESEIHQALLAAFPSQVAAADLEVVGYADANHGKGVFSRVLRVELASVSSSGSASVPSSVIVKLPATGGNGEVGRRSGAYRREALAYRDVLPGSPVRSPACYAVVPAGDDATFVLEDLSGLRFVDQLDGLGAADAAAVAVELRRFHDHWQHHPMLDHLPVRRATPASFAPEALEAGLDALVDRWADDVHADSVAAYRHLVARRQAAVDAFVAVEPVTLCHGDPRADNLAYADDGRPVLFDWQQLGVQFGAADLAWLAATSLTVKQRRSVDADLVTAYGTTADHYRLGFVLPGLAVLLLAQRDVPNERSRSFVATSLQRVGAALIDLDVTGGSPRG